MSFDMESRRDFLKVLGLGAAGLALSGNALAQDSAPASNATTQASASGSGPFDLRPFGKQLKVPSVCFGAMGINASNVNVLRAGLQAGFTMIDTALGYGRGGSEMAIGQAIKGMPREKLIIHTKASGFPAGNLPNMSDADAEAALRKLVESSLRNMGIEYIDTYVLLHGTSSPEEVTSEKLRAAAEKLKKEGKIRNLGVSTHSNYAATCTAAINAGWYDFVMTALPITAIDKSLSAPAEEATDEGAQQPARRRRAPKPADDMVPVLKLAQEKNVGIMGMKVLAHARGAQQQLKAKYAAMGDKVNEAQLAYKSVVQNPSVSTVTIGIQNMQHLQDALALPKLQLA